MSPRLQGGGWGDDGEWVSDGRERHEGLGQRTWRWGGVHAFNFCLHGVGPLPLLAAPHSLLGTTPRPSHAELAEPGQGKGGGCPTRCHSWPHDPIGASQISSPNRNFSLGKQRREGRRQCPLPDSFHGAHWGSSGAPCYAHKPRKSLPNPLTSFSSPLLITQHSQATLALFYSSGRANSPP